MSDAASRVRVDIRHVQLAEAASCEPASNGLFVAMDDPPPVRSILAVSDGDGAPRAFEVTAVVEVAPEGGVRGFHGRFIESDALARFERVGTEHLSDGEPEGDATDGEHADADDAGLGTQMAMPAPVVDPDESEPIDLGEEQPSEAENASADESDTVDGDPAAADEPNTEGEAGGEDGSENGSDDGGGRKGKRRRGRKRK
jgi:hypothetical protein